MKTRPFHHNEEYIRGFVDGLIHEYEITLGPFLSWIYDYSVDVKILNDEEKIHVNIPFAIDTDKGSKHVYFDVNFTDSIDALRRKVQLTVEQIIQYIETFKRES